MKIYDSTEYIDEPRAGDLMLKVNSQWDFGSRSICYRKTSNGTIIAYDLRECVEVVNPDTKHTKWSQAEVTQDVVKQLEADGYEVGGDWL